MDFTFKITDQENHTLISLSGDLLDKEASSEFYTEMENLIAEGKTHVIFDLENMNYLNSTGLNVLINVFTKIRNAGGEAVITNIPKKVNQVLLITKLNTVFNVAPTMEEAERLIENAVNLAKDKSDLL